jgi:hypothetical protein
MMRRPADGRGRLAMSEVTSTDDGTGDGDSDSEPCAGDGE